MYCAKHAKKAREFVAALKSDVPRDFRLSGRSLYEASNTERLQAVQDIVQARGEINLFTTSQDHMAMLIHKKIERLQDEGPAEYQAVVDFFACALRPGDVGEVRAFTDLIAGKISAGGVAEALGWLASFQVPHAPVKIDLFQTCRQSQVKSMFHLDLAGTGMDPIFYRDAAVYNTPCFQPAFEKTRAAYQRYMQDLLELYFGIPPEEAKAAADNIYALEMRVAGTHQSPVEKRSGNCVVEPVRIAKAFPRAVTEFYKQYAAPDVDISDCHIAYSPAVLELERALSEGVDQRALELYLSWLALQEFCKFALPAKFGRLHSRFYHQAQRGQAKSNQPFFDIVIWQRDNMQDAIAKMVKEQGPDNSAGRAETVEMLRGLLDTACEEIVEVDHWPGQSQDAKAKLEHHIHSIQIQVGYPDDFPNASYKLSSTTTVSMMLEIGKHNVRHIVQTVHNSPQTLSWAMNPLVANACYNSSTNTIIMTETMCQEPFRGQPAAFIAAHEITHSFDDQGIQAVRNIPIQNTLGFSQLCHEMESWTAQQGHEGCEPDPKLTLGENLADLIGFRITLRQFQAKIQTERGREPRDAEIIAFYRSYALMWGGASSETLQMIRLIKDPHQNPHERVTMATSPLPPCLSLQN